MAAYEHELDLIKRYIKDFDPKEFSTVLGTQGKADIKRQKMRAKRFKERISRRRLLEQKIKDGEFMDGYDTSDVQITQEQIDELLQKRKLNK